MQTITRRHRQAAEAATARIVLANIVQDTSLPYNLKSLDEPRKCYDFWHSAIATQSDHEPDKETLVVVLLNSRLAPFAWNRVSLGGCSETSAHPREIMRPVIAGNAHAFLLMHNHPSGDPTPSRADESITRKMIEVAALMQVYFLDHTIIGRPSPGRAAYYSFREAGMVP